MGVLGLPWVGDWNWELGGTGQNCVASAFVFSKVLVAPLNQGMIEHKLQARIEDR